LNFHVDETRLTEALIAAVELLENVNAEFVMLSAPEFEKLVFLRFATIFVKEPGAEKTILLVFDSMVLLDEPPLIETF
jgi:hypothetical protein